MPALIIDKLSPAELAAKNIYYTALPNELFSGGLLGLNPVDSGVLNHLFTHKPTGWNLNRRAIANAIGKKGTYAVNQSIKKLQEIGFLSYERDYSGHTKWHVSIPEKILAALVKSPHVENPHVENPHVEIQHALIKNISVEKNIETTNGGAVFEPAPVVPVVVENSVFVDLPKEINTEEVRKDFAGLTKEQQALTLAATIAYIESLKIKGVRFCPVAIIRGMAKKAKNGQLSAPVDKAMDKPGGVVDKKQANRKEFIAFMTKHRDRMKEDFKTRSVIHSATWGDITYLEFRDFEERRL